MTIPPSFSTPAPGTIWHLSYGSNMCPSVLSGRRKIKPIESRPVIVPGYWLSFDIGGLPFVEPCYASILKMDPARMHQRIYAQFVHDRTKFGQEFVWDETHPEKSYPPVLQGVVHRISEYDWQKIIQSEGGWGHDVPTGYDQIDVDCRVYEPHSSAASTAGEHISAKVLIARPLSIKTQCQPSARYKNLLTSGAAHHGLDPAYQRYLSSIVPYECAGSRSRLARSVFMVFNLPMILAFYILVRRNVGKPIEKHTQPPYWLAWYFDRSFRFSNVAHDYVIAPLFGSGRCSSLEQQALTRKRIQESLAQNNVLPEKEQRAQEEEPKVVKFVEKVVESTAP
ncbi:hypothetical protein EMPS_10046 [Entomortierella parvispora]|uniref:gamma-glutamylcyclotransferase n=1 Tax=Entomortierella parvispora TaxID=205924 RepID=A0A9P3HK17_9FUNG|nr:hypothetical protein EMPS_10046 [Entomortierella parvispora]